MTNLAQRTIERAVEALGVTEHPHGSNRGPEVDQYLRSVGLDPTREAYPWCAAFVCYQIGHASVDIHEPTTLKRTASCRKLVEFNHALALAEPEDGCIFVHLTPDGHGHTGFVVTARSDGSIQTIEGNSDASGSRTGGSVVRQVRGPAYAQHYLRIA
jgi:hypothetical protein